MLIGQQAILTAAHCVSDGQMNKLTASTFKIFFAALSSSFESNTKGGIQGLSVNKIFHIICRNVYIMVLTR